MNRRGLTWQAAWIVLAGVGLGSTALRAQETAAKAVDPTGTWTWETTFRDNTFQNVLKLKLEGENKVTGTYQGFGDQTSAVEEGRLDGNKLSFQISRTFGERDFTIDYKGTVSASTITGTIEFPGRDEAVTREWEAKRLLDIADVLGLWKFRSERDNGEAMESSLKISREGEAVKAIYTSPWRDHEIEKVSLSDNILSFILEGETDNGGSYRLVYKGKPVGDSITGTVEYRFGDREGSREFTGQREIAKAEKKGPDYSAVLGKWTVRSEGRNGQTRESTLTITEAEGALKCVYTRTRRDEEISSDVSNLKLAGDVLTFEISREFNDRSFVTKYEAKISGNSLTGTQSFQGRNDEARTREFTGTREAPAAAERETAEL